ncbi:MAG: hypothetical protein IPH57_07265 [Saprospiraceae bacterium]|nr:hypothetical protein [Saprospiraceae bacterium]
MNRVFLLFFIFSFCFPLFSQNFFRIKTDFTIKAKTPTGQQQLTVGKIYYDKNIKQIVYDISFPEKEIWVQKDTTLFKIVNSKIVSKQNIPNMVEFTIYHLVLNGKLADYGLKNTNFKLKKVEKVEKSIISTWEPPSEFKKVIGDILMMNENQQLTGIVFKNIKDEVVSKQFFRNYVRIKGLSFPMELIKENYINGKRIYEITTFSNVIVNDYSSNKYDYKIPKGK